MKSETNQLLSQFHKKAMVLAVGSVATLGVASESFAQLEEIIVSATRRDASIIDIPYNISAVSGEQLASMGVADFSKLTRVVPGLQLTDRGVRDNTNSARLIMRGLNTESAALSDVPFLTSSPVAVYVDETPVFTNLRMYDVERVEVLRGPQGTLYGAGALGGTIRYLHKKPSTEGFEGAIDASIGVTEDADDEAYSVKGVLNIPLGDAVALRVSGGQDYYPGFIDATRLMVLDSDGVGVPVDPSDPFGPAQFEAKKDVNEAEVSFFRGSLLFDLSETLSVQLNYHHQEEEGDHRDAQSGVEGVADRTTLVSRLEGGERELDLYSMEIEADLGFASLTSATAYTEIESSSITDGTGIYDGFGYIVAPTVTAPIEFNTEKETIVQELRLVSEPGEKVDWLVGAYYYSEESVDLDEFDFLKGAYGLLGPYLTGPDDLFIDLFRDSEFEDLAVYGEVTLHVSDKLDVTGGVRAFDQEFEAGGFVNYPAFGDFPSEFVAFDETDVLFKLNVSYDLSDESMLYATFSQGFRRGGANSYPTEGPLGEPEELPSYDSDSADNYEVGIKGTFADAHQYTLAAYFIEWSDAQIGILTPNIGYDAAINAGDAETYGLEVELFGNLTDRLSYNVGYSYTNAELAETFTQGITGLKGTVLPGVSEHTAAASIDYTQPLSNGFSITAHADVTHRSEFTNSVDRTVDIYREFDGFTLVAASLSLEADSWTATLFAENLTDEEGISAQNEPSINGTNHYVEWLTRPRTIGLRVSYQF